MNRLYPVLFILLGLLIGIRCASFAPKPYYKVQIPIIKIHISEVKQCQMTFSGSYDLVENNRLTARIPDHQKIALYIGEKANTIHLDLNGNRWHTVRSEVQFRSDRTKSFFEFAGKTFPGNLEIRFNQKGLLEIINIVDVETYLKGVVAIEMGKLDKSKMEALKAQAVASRTYALKKIEENKNKKRPYDVMADVNDQVYTGISHQNKLANLAVTSTFGEVITYKHEVVYAYYHSTCGGRTEFGKNVFASSDFAYLNGVADNFGQKDFCSGSPYYRWIESFTNDEILEALKTRYPGRIMNGDDPIIKDVVVKQRYPSGRVQELEISFLSGGESILLNAKQIRGTLRRRNGAILPSTLFRIAKYGNKGDPDGVMLIGAGNGHGVGMCQWGAIGMAQEGYNYRQILQHYYRGTSVEKQY